MPSLSVGCCDDSHSELLFINLSVTLNTFAVTLRLAQHIIWPSALIQCTMVMATRAIQFIATNPWRHVEAQSIAIGYGPLI